MSGSRRRARSAHLGTRRVRAPGPGAAARGLESGVARTWITFGERVVHVIASNTGAGAALPTPCGAACLGTRGAAHRACGPAGLAVHDRATAAESAILHARLSPTGAGERRAVSSLLTECRGY